jgi:hypothetical protein
VSRSAARHRSGLGGAGHQLNGRLRQSAIDPIAGEQKPQATGELIMF